VFVAPEGKYINLKKEMSYQWQDFHSKCASSPDFVKEVESSVIDKTYRWFQDRENKNSSFAID